VEQTPATTTDTKTTKETPVDQVTVESRTPAISFKAYTVTPVEGTDGGTVEALVSIFNNTDLVGDRVLPGAFAESLDAIAAAGKALPFIWAHDWGSPESYIGKVIQAEERPEGLYVKATLFDTPRAQQVRTLLKERVVTEFSFAFDVIEEQTGADGVNELVTLSILECGPCLKGANPATVLIGAKDAPAAGQKIGRTLSTRNEDALRQAVDLLQEVLLQVEQQTNSAKPEEPQVIEAKSEERKGLDPHVALALVKAELAGI
jgi:HK97 family phage prohead protease